MNRKIAIPFIMILVTLIQGDLSSLLPGQDYIVIEDFEKYNFYPFAEWQHKEKFKDSHLVYSLVKENSNKFLRGSTCTNNISIQLVKQVNDNRFIGSGRIRWDIHRYPFFSWQWRVHSLPENGNESIPELNDSAAGIYVIFQKRVIPFAGWEYQPVNWIKYVWSSTLPAGTVINRNYSRAGIDIYDGRYVVVALGKKGMGRWITFKRNVLEDYIKFFGARPLYHPVMIGILTDANSTGSRVQADYDNIRAYSR